MKNIKQDEKFVNLSYRITIPLVFLLVILSFSILSQIPKQQAIALRITLSSQTPITANNFLTYVNSTYGIKFLFPYNWSKIEILSEKLNVVKFFSPLINTSENVPATIDISIEKNLGNITTLSEYANHTDKSLNSLLSGFNITQSQPTTLSGLLANERVFDIKQPVSGLDLSVGQVYTIKNNKAYVITYTVPASKYFDYLPTFQKMINSFQITK
jgi:eukaryotic-like serine/threonine-protein kinase